MAEAKVIEITNKEIKSGIGKKGAWSQSLVILDNGNEVRIFNPVNIGDVVVSSENNGYTNWNVKRQKQDFSTALHDVYDKLNTIESLLREALETKNISSDNITSVDTNSDINLDDIPY